MSKHRLVVLGDSLSQGFMSGAIHRTDISYGAMIARAVGARFDVPEFSGWGGLPLNMEDLLRRVSRRFGEDVSWFEFVPMLRYSREFMDGVEDHWERGRGNGPAPNRVHHNQAVWGFEVTDAFAVSEKVAGDAIRKPKDDFFKQVPTDAMYRTARRVLNPSFGDAREHATQIENAKSLGRDGGIQNLVVALGANNALGTVLSLKVKKSTQSEILRPPHLRQANLYRPEHFEVVYAELEKQVAEIDAEHVFLATVPHVTIPPVTRGVTKQGEQLEAGRSPGRRYFEYYTRPWIWDDVFDPGKHPYLTRAEAIEIDAFIDRYNEIIRATADRHTNWHVVDLCGLLDDLATRSRPDEEPRRALPAGFVQAIEQDTRLGYLHRDGRVHLDTRYFHVKRASDRDLPDYLIDEGGFFSLDGVHPTTLGYSLVADLFLDAMKSAGTVGADVALPWADLITADSLANDPPAMLKNLRACLGNLERHWGFSRILSSFG